MLNKIMLCGKSFILYSCNKIKENHSLKQTYFLHFSQLYMLSPVKKKTVVSNEMGKITILTEFFL